MVADNENIVELYEKIFGEQQYINRQRIWSDFAPNQ